MIWPDLDPEAARMGGAIRTQLALAVPDGDVVPALNIAEQMVRRGLASSTAPRLVAMQLVELSTRHLDRHGTSEADPYLRYARHLIDNVGVLTDLDLTIAVFGRVLDLGVTRGWLDALWYDRLAAFGQGDSEFRDLLARIERRTSPGDSQAGPTPLSGVSFEDLVAWSSCGGETDPALDRMCTDGQATRFARAFVRRHGPGN